MNFSKRMGLVPQKVIQVDSIDEDLRNSIYNILRREFFSQFEEYNSYDGCYYCTHKGKDYFDLLWTDFFKWDIEKILDYPLPEIKAWFFKAEWYSIYDFLEFVIRTERFIQGEEFIFDSIINKLNVALEREVSAYRIVDKTVVPITNPTELKEIEDAIITTSSLTAYNGANKHLETALGHLSNRTSPDYRNSIKESISAVESIVGMIIGDKKSTLGTAIKKLEKDFELHPSLKEAFSKLYGWTSDEGGIRHALMDGSNAGYEEAKFMLVVCSAFVNFVLGKYRNTISPCQ